MAGFDPKAYLAKKQKTFDPQAYLAKKGAQSPTDNVEQVMPEWLSTKDRVIAKNLAQNPQKQVEYLQATYPDKQFTLGKDQQVLAKDVNSGQWQVLDPDTGVFSSDIGQDALDLGYDTASGIATNVAGALGALGGATVGSIVPGAGTALGAGTGMVGASGLAGAGLEAFRQKLGQQLGIPQEVNEGDVKMAGALNAIMPAFAGSAAMKSIGAPEVKGLATKAIAKVGPRVMHTFSGVPAFATKAYYEFMDKVDDLNIGKDGGLSSYVEGVSENVNKSLSSIRDRLGKNVRDAITEKGIDIDIRDAKKSLLDQIEKIKSKKWLSDADAKKIEQIQNIDDIYKTSDDGSKEMISDFLNADEAFNLQQEMKKYTKYGQEKINKENEFEVAAARDFYEGLNKAFDKASEGASKKAKDEYASFMKQREYLKPQFKDAETTFQTLSTMPNKAKTIRRELIGKADEALNLNLEEPSKVVQAYNYYADPSLSVIGGPGVTSTTRSTPIMGAAATLGNQVGGTTGAAASMMAAKEILSPAAMKKVLKLTKNMNTPLMELYPLIKGVPGSDKTKMDLLSILSKSGVPAIDDNN